MSQLFPLSSLPCSESAVISSYDAGCEAEERLRDLGFVESSPVRCVFSSMSGDPRAYRIKDTVIALRRSDAHSIMCCMDGGAL